jgi:hypothetical protein
MKEIYQEIYSELLGAWKADGPGISVGMSAFNRDFSIEIYEKIRKVEANQNVKLRSDARLLLLVNFQIMIMQPLYDGKLKNIEEIYEIVENDLSFLISESVKEKNKYLEYKFGEENENKISAHVVLDALTKNWEKMSVSKVDLWE